MKAILTKHKDNSYEFKNSRGETWHIFIIRENISITTHSGKKKFIDYVLTKKLISKNPDFVQTGTIVRKIPNHLKTIIFEIQKQV